MTSLSAAIVGIGESRLGKVPERSSLQLIADAAHAAAEDAGLPLHGIDGLLTVRPIIETWSNPAAVVASQLGLRPAYFAAVDLAGASGAAMIHHAAMAIAAGQCETVLCVAGQSLLSAMSRGGAVSGMAEGGAAHPQFEAVHGPLVPSLYALVAARHMHEYGTTEEQLAEVAVAIRAHAALNPHAQRRDPITVADVMASRRITSPLKVLDCATVSDGACAAIVTSAARARDLRRAPVHLLGQGYGLRHSYVGETMNLTTSGARESGEAAYRSAGLGPGDVDIAQLYDCFTITVIVELEDLGFCPKGEGGRFVEGNRIGPGGGLPVTTHGGMLSAVHSGYAGGFFHVLEGVRQLRGDAGERQVPDAEVALVHGNGGVIATHCTIILGSESTR